MKPLSLPLQLLLIVGLIALAVILQPAPYVYLFAPMLLLVFLNP
jgi:hypothetical protein